MEYDVDVFVKVFCGVKVVCNMVGLFLSFGFVGVEVVLKVGCYYFDMIGE